MKNICTVLLAIWTLAGYSQELHQTIRGVVVDKESKEVLSGVTVVVVNTQPQIGALSNERGEFRLERVPLGRRTLKLSSLGYEEITVPEILVGSGKEVILNLELSGKYITTAQVEVVAGRNQVNNEMATISSRSFSVEETKRYAASVNDPARMALSYAGVANNGDFDNGIVIRGNSPRGLLWRMEGVEIPNPNHFASDGASGGSISMLSVNMLSNSDFLVGAFPAEYGNALSGVFDIKLRTGNNEKREYAFQLGALGADMALEGPFGKSKASYLVNYRYSTLALLNGVGVNVAGDAVPDFQDLSFKINLPSQKAGTFSFFGLGGYNKAAQADTGFRYTNKEALGIAGLSHLYLFKNNKTYLKSVLSFSRTYGDDDEEDVNAQKNYYQVYGSRNTSDAYRASVLVNHKFSNRHTLRAGLIASELDFDLSSDYYDFSDQRLIKLYSQQGGTQLYQAYVQSKYRLTEKLFITPGLHYLNFALNNSQSLEPRMGMRYDIDARQALTAGMGMHSRIEFIGNYFANVMKSDSSFFTPNKDLSPTKAMHYVLGYQRALSEFINLKAEAYYQHLYHVPVPVDTADRYSSLDYDGGIINTAMLNKGTGTNYGLEITLERPLKNDFYFLLTASLYNSTYKTARGEEFNTHFNGNYMSSFLVGKEYKVGKGRNNIFGLNLRVIYAGGLRNTPIDLARSVAEDEPVYIESKRNTLKNAAYFRPDLRVNYKINRQKVSHEISLDLQNFINHQNIYTVYYDRDAKELKTAYQMGLVPILNYRIEF